MAPKSSPQYKGGEIRGTLYSREIPYVIVLTRRFIPTCYTCDGNGYEIGHAAF